MMYPSRGFAGMQFSYGPPHHERGILQGPRIRLSRRGGDPILHIQRYPLKIPPNSMCHVPSTGQLDAVKALVYAIGIRVLVRKTTKIRSNYSCRSGRSVLINDRLSKLLQKRPSQPPSLSGDPQYTIACGPGTQADIWVEAQTRPPHRPRRCAQVPIYLFSVTLPSVSEWNVRLGPSVMLFAQ